MDFENTSSPPTKRITISGDSSNENVSVSEAVDGSTMKYPNSLENRQAQTKVLFDAAIEETDPKIKGQMFRQVVDNSLGCLFESLGKELSIEEQKKHFETTNVYLKEIVEKHRESVYYIFQSGLDYTAVNHSVNVMALMMNVQVNASEIAKKINKIPDEFRVKFEIKNEDINKAVEFLKAVEGSSEKDIMKFVLATNYHDIGKSTNPDFKSSDKIERGSDRFKRMKKHPEDGYKILKKLGIEDPIILNAALCHHIDAMGKGYPENLREGISPTHFDQLVRLFDSFEAMTSKNRAYGKPKSANEALNELKIESKKGSYLSYQWLILIHSRFVGLVESPFDTDR